MFVQQYCVPREGDLVLVRADSRPGRNRLGGFGNITSLDLCKLTADVKPIVGGERSLMKRVSFGEMVGVDEEPDPLETSVPAGGTASTSIAFSAAAAGFATGVDAGVNAGGGNAGGGGSFAGSLSVDEQISLLKKKKWTRWWH